MVESNDNPELVNFNRVRDHERARKVPPVERPTTDFTVIAGTLSGDLRIPDNAAADGQSAGTLQVPADAAANRPQDPEAAARHLRFGITAVLVVVFITLWILQQRKRP